MAALSSTAQAILTILNNINELIAHNGRQDAVDVMKALKVYADNRNFLLPEDKVENFYAVVLDSRTQTLSSLVYDLARDVVATDKSKT